MKLNLITLFLLLLLSYRSNKISCSPHHENTSSMLSLLEFKEAITNDPQGALSSWNRSTPFCRWKGVRCSSTHQGRVVILDLAGQRLAGTISSSLGNLTFLRRGGW